MEARGGGSDRGGSVLSLCPFFFLSRRHERSFTTARMSTSRILTTVGKLWCALLLQYSFLFFFSRILLMQKRD